MLWAPGVFVRGIRSAAKRVTHLNALLMQLNAECPGSPQQDNLMYYCLISLLLMQLFLNFIFPCVVRYVSYLFELKERDFYLNITYYIIH